MFFNNRMVWFAGGEKGGEVVFNEDNIKGNPPQDAETVLPAEVVAPSPKAKQEAAKTMAENLAALAGGKTDVGAENQKSWEKAAESAAGQSNTYENALGAAMKEAEMDSAMAELDASQQDTSRELAGGGIQDPGGSLPDMGPATKDNPKDALAAVLPNRKPADSAPIAPIRVADNKKAEGKDKS